MMSSPLRSSPVALTPRTPSPRRSSPLQRTAPSSTPRSPLGGGRYSPPPAAETTLRSSSIVIATWAVFVLSSTLLSVSVSLFHVVPVDHASSTRELDAAMLFGIQPKQQQQQRSSPSDSIQSKLQSKPDPKIALLMSFPNSGNTYTLANMAHMTNLSTATVYEQEVNASQLRPALPTTSAAPFLFDHNQRVPDKYILTKTHCLGYCDHCYHAHEAHTVETFDWACRRAVLHYEENVDCDNNPRPDTPVWYMPRHAIAKVVHLIRDPFDNIVARMHLGIQNRKQTDFPRNVLKVFDHSQAGVLAWCGLVDEHFYQEALSKRPDLPLEVQPYPTLTNATLQRLQNVPCHSEWFRYVQWHNLAVAWQREYLVLTDRHQLYYEDYSYTLNDTVYELAQFLEQDIVQTQPLDFYAGKSYRHLYSKSMQIQVALLIRDLATPECWDLLKPYFAEILPEEALDQMADDEDGDDDGGDDDENDDDDNTSDQDASGDSGKDETAKAEDQPSAVARRALSEETATAVATPPPQKLEIPKTERVSVLTTQFNQEKHRYNHSIVWLLTYPQSGSQMVLRNVMHMTGYSAATNYGRELVKGVVKSVPVIQNNTEVTPNGLVVGSPIWMNPALEEPHHVLTLTRCTGGCFTCLPAVNADSFRIGCRTVNSVVEKGEVDRTIYPLDLEVRGSLTLIRNPFDVIRSRMNRGLRIRKDQLNWADEAEMLQHRDAPKGLRKYCRIVDAEFQQMLEEQRRDWKVPERSYTERTIRGYQQWRRDFRQWRRRWYQRVSNCPWRQLVSSSDGESGGGGRYSELERQLYHPRDKFQLAEDLLQRYKQLPCYSEWIRYIQWYNYALQMTRASRHLHFEEFSEGRPMQSLEDLLTGLDLDMTQQKPLPFSRVRARHRMLYTDEQAQRAASLVLELATTDVWHALKRYFQDEDWFDTDRILDEIARGRATARVV